MKSLILAALLFPALSLAASIPANVCVTTPTGQGCGTITIVDNPVPVPTPTPTPTPTCDTVQSIITEMTVAGERTSNGWDIGPQVNTGNLIPWWANQITSWGEIYRDSSISKDTNTRIEVRDMALWVKMSATGAWQRIDWTMDVTGNGKLYKEDYSSQINYTPRREADGGVSVKIPIGYIFHFWPTDGNVKNLPGISVTANGQNKALIAIFVVAQARLIVDDLAGKDDRSAAKYVMSNGADYYGSGTCCAESKFTPNGEIGTSRKKYVTSDWQWFNFFSSQSSAYIQANAPPLPCSK